MTCEANDRLLNRFRDLTALEPAPERRERLRARCHAALAERRAGADRPATTHTDTLSGLTLGLSVAYLFAIGVDLLRVYLRI